MVLFYLSFFLLALVMIVYLFRHYVFSALVLIYGRSSNPVLEEHNLTPFISIIVPAHNEELVIGRLLQRIVDFCYPKDKLQVIVVNDGSTDSTGKIIDDFVDKHPFIHVIHKSLATGKPAALNSALKLVIGKFVYFFDADYLPENSFLKKSVLAFLDPKVGLVQANIKVINEVNWVSKVVCLERFSGFRVDQLARDILGLVPQFGGTAGAIRYSLLSSLGGFDEKVLADDTDLTFRVLLSGYKIKYLVNVVCFEEAVETWIAYWHQRCRWSMGHMQCAVKHLFPLLRNKGLTVKERFDAFLLLNIYFVPILVGLGWLFTGVSFFLGFGLASGKDALIVTALYLFAGNSAPLTEIFVGTILENRLRLLLYIPLLVAAFFLNVFICTKALFNILTSKTNKKSIKWTKTTHNGLYLKPQIANASCTDS